MRFNFYAGGFAASLVLTISVILAELIHPFKNFLASTFTHHWIGKIVLITLAFLIYGLVYKSNKMFGRDIKDVSWKSVIWGIDIIFLFYLVFYFF